MTDPIVVHYGTEDLTARVEAALAQAGLGSGPLSAGDLEPLDQFHFRGLAATEELVAALELAEGARVLDIGCGLGGPARYLAGTFAAHVTGIDLNPSFVALGRMLAGRVALRGSVELVTANALALPFADGTFDHAITQHVAMNIADRDALYTEARRVLRPHGRLAIYDVIAGEGPLVFPVPWARDASSSHLVDAATLRTVLARSGFVERSWKDTTAEGLAWFEEFRKAPPPRAPGLGLVMGADFPAMARTFAQNLKEGRARLVQTIVERT